MTAAVGYARVSTEQQAMDGTSLKDQVEQIHLYCKASGLDLLNVFVDEGVSGATEVKARPAGKRMLRELRTNKEIQVVVCKGIDRLWRSLADCLFTIDEWNKKGIDLVLLDFGKQVVDTRTPLGKLFLQLVGAFAEFERSVIADRITSGLHRRKASGLKWNRHAPFGFRWDGDLAAIDEREDKVISAILRLAEQNMKDEQIAGYLAQMARTDHRMAPREGKWTKAKVWKIRTREQAGELKATREAIYHRRQAKNA